MSLNRDYGHEAEQALACIFSVSGEQLGDSEIALFKAANPLGFILFKRNCDNPQQVKALVDHLKELVGRDCPVLIDQEGGRVQRLKPPHWREHKPMRFFGDAYKDDPESALETLRFETLRLAEELVDVGVNVNCAPVLDLCFEGAHDIIGDRAFSDDPEVVARLGLSVCRHFLSVGITPIIKHIPGHGRACADSHLELPYVDAAHEDLSCLDFAPFREIAKSDVGQAVWAMTAHITYQALGANRPVSLSASAIQKIIREEIGFDGILICDDLDMKALDEYGSVSEKANEAINAGCDLGLYCAGEFEKMEELAENLPKLSEKTLKRLKNAAIFQNMAA